MEPSVIDILVMWREAEIERRRWLLAELNNIERRWGIGQYQQDGPQIFRLNANSGGTAIPS